MTMTDDERYRETTTLDPSGKALSVECDGVSMPAGYTFAEVNDWVHNVGRQYEELEWHALGAANAYDQLHAQWQVLEQEYRKDKARLDWLADPANGYGAVQLPTVCVERNLGSLRDAIDDAMRLPV